MLFLRYKLKSSDNPIARFKYFCQTNQLNSPIDTNSQKLKVYRNFLVGHGEKCAWSIWSLDSKIDCVSKMNR